jgi:hypothetical protein
MGPSQANAGPVLAALSGGVVVIEIVIVVAIVALLVAVLVLYRRQQSGGKEKQAAPPAADSYYADVTTVQGQSGQQGAFGAQPQSDPFAGFGGQTPPGGAPAPAPAAAPAAPAGAAAPPAGTPAGWLPDPSGAPDTLRYWDGNGWTQHVAQRS